MKIVVFSMDDGSDNPWVIDVKSSSGDGLFTSTKGYKTKASALAAAQRLVDKAHRAKIVVR